MHKENRILVLFLKEDLIRLLNRYQASVGGSTFHMVVQDVTKLNNYDLVKIKVIGSSIQNDNLIYHEKQAKIVYFCLFFGEDQVTFLPFEPEGKSNSIAL